MSARLRPGVSPRLAPDQGCQQPASPPAQRLTSRLIAVASAVAISGPKSLMVAPRSAAVASTTSFGSYSGAVPNEKITWGKLAASTPKFVVESDATICAPLLFAWVLGQ